MNYKKYINRLENWWYTNIYTSDGRKKIIIIGVVSFIVLSILAGGLPILAIIGLIVLLIAVWKYYTTYSFKLFLTAFILYVCSTEMSLILLIILGFIILYNYLNEKRKERITKIANMSPNELSKVKHNQPAVEITIRGGRRE